MGVDWYAAAATVVVGSLTHQQQQQHKVWLQVRQVSHWILLLDGSYLLLRTLFHGFHQLFWDMVKSVLGFYVSSYYFCYLIGAAVLISRVYPTFTSQLWLLC